MPETAALIVRGTFLDDAQGEITYLDEVLDLGRGAAPGERSVLSAQTTSTFEITKVIQGGPASGRPDQSCGALLCGQPRRRGNHQTVTGML